MKYYDRKNVDVPPICGRNAGLAGKILLALCSTFAWTANVNAQPSTVLRNRVEPWGLYCTDVPTRPTLNDCSLVTAVASKDDPEAAAKLAVTVVSDDGDIELTVMIPKIRYIGPGIAISNGKGTLVRASIDECTNDGCTSLVRLDGFLLKKLLTGERSWIEYQVSRNETTRLALNFNTFGDAITALYRAVGIGSSDDASQIASSPARSTLAKVRVDIERDAVRVGGGLRPFTDRCKALLTSMTFTVTPALKIKDQQALDQWLKETRLCMEGAVAKVHTIPVNGASDKDTSNMEQMQAYQVFEALRVKSGAGQVYLAGQSTMQDSSSAR